MKARLARPLIVVDAVFIGVALAFVFVAGPRVAGEVSRGFDDFGMRVGALFPTADGSRPIDLPTTAGNVSGQLAADNVPDFTRDPQLKVAGRVPAFANTAGRTIAVRLNGTDVGSLTPDAAGAFTTTLSLREGPNAIELALLAGSDVVATSSYIVVLDRQAPTLVVTRPANGDSVEAPAVVVEGKAEVGTTVIVNDRAITPSQDGTFSETFNANAGPLTITVVARDRAGNEATVKNQITVKPQSTTAALAVNVLLDKAKVTPGGFVTATINVTASGRARPSEQVTLSVGVITIGSTTTDVNGNARISFFAPPNEGDAAVVVLASGASGRATLTVAK